MTDATTSILRADTGHPPPEPAPPARTWFRTRGGRRYGWEIAAIIVVKLVLLMLLWLVFIKPFPRPVMAPAAVVQQFYLPATPPAPHD